MKIHYSETAMLSVVTFDDGKTWIHVTRTCTGRPGRTLMQTAAEAQVSEEDLLRALDLLQALGESVLNRLRKRQQTLL